MLASVGYRADVARLIAYVPGGDVTGHFLLMGTLAFLVVLAFARAHVGGRRLGVLGAALIVTALVTIDEVAQLVLQLFTKFIIFKTGLNQSSGLASL